MIRDNHDRDESRSQENLPSGMGTGSVGQVEAPASRPATGRGGSALAERPHLESGEHRRLVALRTDVNDQNRAMMTAARLVHSTNRVRNFAAVLLCLMICSIIALAWLPWQQSARGNGRVLAYSPGERPQEITSPVKGVVERVPEKLAEGQFVEKGELLLEIRPFAADLRAQLGGQQTNLNTKLDTARIKAKAYKDNITAYETARDAAEAGAKQAIAAAEADLRAKEQMLIGYKAEAEQARLDFLRQEELNREGITATKDLEKRLSEREAKNAKVLSGEQDVVMSEAKIKEKQEELKEKLSKAQAEVDKARAEYQAALGEIAVVEKEILELQVKQSELARLEVRAPRDGYIQRLPVFAGGQTVKEGDYLLTLVPRTDDHAVELYILGNDMPLVHPGDHVRLQFEGWPALQFSGWPSVAVGTFGGQVALVDPTDDGTGKFRVMIRPAPDEVWPDEAYLRQGVRANGWVMLGTVPLAYEIWRQLNGFPPVLPDGQKLQDGKDATKKPKLPK